MIVGVRLFSNNDRCIRTLVGKFKVKLERPEGTRAFFNLYVDPRLAPIYSKPPPSPFCLLPHTISVIERSLVARTERTSDIRNNNYHPSLDTSFTKSGNSCLAVILQ